MSDKSKQQRCRFCHINMGEKHIESHCVVDGWENDKVRTVTEKECESCDKFDSRYIEYPLTINGIENAEIRDNSLFHEVGSLCEVSPCSEEYEGKSYIGVYLGDLPVAISSSFSPVTGILSNSAMTNPAIFVPELKKIIYGCESFWRTIDSIDDFKGISKEEIENTWYIQLLKAFYKEK